MNYISRLLPKYFLNNNQKNMYVPSLLFGRVEDDGIELDFSVLDRPFVNYNAGTSDLEVQYTTHLRDDPIAIELFAFICFFSSVQKIQINNFFFSYSETLKRFPAKKQKELIDKKLKKLYQLRLIRRTFIPEVSSRERKIASYSMTVDGTKMAEHMRKPLGIQGKIYNPDQMYLNHQNVSRVIKRQWAIVDVFLAASTLESFVGFRNHLSNVGTIEQPMAIKESQCVLTLELVNGLECNLISYVALLGDSPYYNKVKVEQFKLLMQRYPDGRFPELKESLNFLCFIVFTKNHVDELVNQLELKLEATPPLLFIVLEDFQNSSIKEAFYGFENGEIVPFAPNLASK